MALNYNAPIKGQKSSIERKGNKHHICMRSFFLAGRSILVAVLGLYLFVTYNLCFFFTVKSSSLQVAGCCQIILIHPQRQTYQT